MTQDNVVLLHRAIKAYNEGDLTFVFERAADDIEVHAAAGLANAGTYRGRAGFERWVAEWLEAWSDFSLDVLAVREVDGRFLLIDVRQTGVGSASGLEVEMNLTQLVEVQDGQITRFHLYHGHRDAERALEPLRAYTAAPMALKTDAVGKSWEPVSFEVEAERIAQYADAVGESSPIHRDSEAAKAAGYRDVVAPPMFAVVYSSPAMGPALFDPDVEMNFAAMVHGSQEFAWGEPVCAGDEITTQVTCNSIDVRDGKGFYVFESLSTNQDGAQVVKATWTNIVRGVGDE